MHFNALCWQHFRAKNDPNGNPQRLVVVYDMDGQIRRVINEGYSGIPWALLKGIKQIPSVNISKSDYHAMLREFKEVSIP